MTWQPFNLQMWQSTENKNHQNLISWNYDPYHTQEKNLLSVITKPCFVEKVIMIMKQFSVHGK